MNHLGGRMRLLVGGALLAGASFIPFISAAGATEDCTQASPSDTTCAPTTTVAPTTIAPTTTVVVGSTTVEKATTTSTTAATATSTTQAPVQVLAESANNTPAQAATPVSVKSAELAFTGSDSAKLALLGGGALLLGAGALVASRRKRTED